MCETKPTLPGLNAPKVRESVIELFIDVEQLGQE
jgi:hypothetical protein